MSRRKKSRNRRPSWRHIEKAIWIAYVECVCIKMADGTRYSWHISGSWTKTTVGTLPRYRSGRSEATGVNTPLGLPDELPKLQEKFVCDTALIVEMKHAGRGRLVYDLLRFRDKAMGLAAERKAKREAEQECE